MNEIVRQPLAEPVYSISMSSLLLVRNGVPEVKFALGESTAIGRSSTCEIQLIDPRLSRRNTIVLKRDQAHYVQDLESCNGTFLNGVRLTGEARLAQGDAIGIGGQLLVFDADVEVLHAPQQQKMVYLLNDEDNGAQTRTFDTETAGFSALESDSLLAIHELTVQLIAELEPTVLYDRLLDRLIAHVGADRGFILMKTRRRGTFRPLAVRTDKKAVALSRALVDRVLESRQPLLLDNALDDVSFQGSKSLVRHQIRSVMVVPLLLGDEVLGLLQLDSNKKDAYDRRALTEVSLLTRAAAVALHNCEKFDRERRRNLTQSTHRFGESVIVGNSVPITHVLQMAQKAAATDARVLITGESGTGKELVARLIHDRSERADAPWVAINCAAMADTLLESELYGHEKGAFTGATDKKRGCFELADGGTLFLDEVGELSPAAQVKLLRAIQEHCFYRVGGEQPIPVDIRIVAATNQQLKAKVDEGTFRQDLYYRLNVITLELPALRQRRDDISQLFQFFLERFSGELGKPQPKVEPAVLTVLEAYDWPGNVRELQNVVERLVVMDERSRITPDDLPSELTAPALFRSAGRTGTLRRVLSGVEKEMIERALRECNHQKSAACKALGISRPTLDKKIAQYELEI